MKPTVTIGVDPGECTGVGIGIGSRLVACYDSTPDGLLVLPGEAQQALLAGAELRARIELPVLYYVPIYGHPKKATSIGNALIREAVSLGEWRRQLRQRNARVAEVKPKEWKGSVPKMIMCRRIVSLLTKDERALLRALGLPKTKIHNVIDGIGLFLSAVGRL